MFLKNLYNVLFPCPQIAIYSVPMTHTWTALYSILSHIHKVQLDLYYKTVKEVSSLGSVCQLPIPHCEC